MLMEMEVDLKDVYTGTTYQIDVERNQICTKCDGSGARSKNDIVDCQVCGGRGIRIVKHMLAPGMYQQMQMQCDHCGGNGRTIKHTCPTCHGARTVKATSTISVDIDRGLHEGAELIYEGEADESPDWETGDLVVRVRTRKDPAGFTRRKEHLYWKQSISVTEVGAYTSVKVCSEKTKLRLCNKALLGFETTIPSLDGHPIKLSSSSGSTIQPGQVQVLHGEGLPRYHSSDFGELFIEYNVVLPSSLNKSTRQKLAEAFGVQVKHEEL